MPKPLHNVSPRSIGFMKSHISSKACVPMNSKSDCSKLSRIIEAHTRQSISSSTLYRIFLHPRPTKPYLHTLDLLAEYCGFENWPDFEIRTGQSEALDFLYNEVPVEHRQIDSLVRICIHQNKLEPLLAYAAQFPFPVVPEMGYKLGFDIYQSLWDNPNKNIIFFKRCHHLPLIRRCFFNMMADQDFALKDYETGVKFFVATARRGKTNEARQEYTLGSCLLFRHYILNNRIDEAMEVGKRLYRTTDIKIAKAEMMPPEISARYLAYRFWYYLHLHQGVQLKKYTIAIRDLWYERMTDWNETEKKAYLYHFGDVFSRELPFSHLEILLKSHFCSLLETIPDFDFEKPLARFLPLIDDSILAKIKRGDHPELSPIWQNVLLSSKRNERFFAGWTIGIEE